MPPFIHEMVALLRRRGLPLGVDDCDALRMALAAGFGWSSHTALIELCVALWAKSAAEADIVRAAFTRVQTPEWTTGPLADPVAVAGGAAVAPPPAVPPAEPIEPPVPDPPDPAPELGAPAARHLTWLTLAPPSTGRSDPSLVLTPQPPLTEREVVQIWRGLRRVTRSGPLTELDVAATLDRYANLGVATPPVLVPARRNTTRLLLLIDRQGSMTPFHPYADHVHRAMQRAGRHGTVTVVYFHNTAGASSDRDVLSRLPNPFKPAIDAVLPDVAPLADGWIYDDPELTVPRGLDGVLSSVAGTTGAIVISDGGAARGGLSPARVIDTAALAKALRSAVGSVAWLNPLPPERWERTTAGQIARHLPMFPLDRAGMYGAVDVLRGRPATVERPL